MPIGTDIVDYLLHPKATGYDMPKTFLYSLILIFSAYALFKILKRMGIKVDERLAIAISPYVVLGSILRVIQDAGIVDSYFFVTPGIYAFVFLITFAALVASKVMDKKYGLPFHKTSFILGILAMPFFLAHISPVNLVGGAVVAAFFFPWIILASLTEWSIENKLITLLHLFDATTTAVSMKFFGYYEQHVLPTFFIDLFGPFSFIFIKLAVIVSVLTFIDGVSKNDKEIEKDFVLYIKLIIGILGAATGIRDFVTLLAGV